MSNKYKMLTTIVALTLVIMAIIYVIPNRSEKAKGEYILLGTSTNNYGAPEHVELYKESAEIARSRVETIEEPKLETAEPKRELVTRGKQKPYIVVNGRRYDYCNQPSGLTVQQLSKILTLEQWSDKIRKHCGQENDYRFENALLNIESSYGVSAVFMLAVAAQESGWGRKTPAGAEYNFFGYGVPDSGINSAGYGFEKEGDAYSKLVFAFAHYAKSMSENYLSPNGMHYDGKGSDLSAFWNGVPFTYGDTVGFTTLGIAKKYNQHGTWQEKIQNIMDLFWNEVR